MCLAWGEGQAGLKGAGITILGCSLTQYWAGSGARFNYLAAFLLGGNAFFIPLWPVGSQYNSPSVLVNRRGVFGGGRRLVSGGTRPRGDGDGFFLRPWLCSTLQRF